MITLEDYMELEPFSLEISLKEPIIFSFLKNLTKHHNENCLEYNKLLKSLDLNINEINSIEKLPYLPVRLFKNLNLKSFDYSDLKTTLYSSGTTGQTSSKIYLDNITERNQRKILVNIVKDFIGRERLPMIILDCRSSVYTSRSTGITGFLPFGKENIFALNEDMSLNLDIINMFLEKHKNKKILLFGSTYLIYSSFYKELLRLNKKLDLSNHILIHGGGWKKLQNLSINNITFKTMLKDICGLTKIHDFYGMVEQTGSIFMECEYGNLHSSIYSDIIIRRRKDLSIANIDEEGFIEVLSILPFSYPGHALLTEDLGKLKGIDNCKCGRLGKYFHVNGRIKNSEPRGCSDTYERKI